MCTNTSTCLVVKIKFISQMVLECGRIYRGVPSQKLLVVKNIPVVLMSQASCGNSKSHKLSIAQWPHYGFNNYTGCNDI